MLSSSVRRTARFARRELSRSTLTATLLVAVLSGTSCTSVDCPSGTVQQSGHCVETGSVVGDPDATVGPGDGAAAAAAMGGNVIDTGVAPGAGNGGTLAGTNGGGAGTAGTAVPPPGAGTSGMGVAGTGGSAGEPCTEAAAQRCSISGAGKRETCSNGVWTAGQPCAPGETCLVEAGATKCVQVAELCRGSGGKTVCDGQGSLVVCSADESIASMMACQSAKHCQAGIAAQTCATCIPKDEHRCTGASLEQCAEDGMSFVRVMPCQTEGLCNPMLGKCTDAVCEPGRKSCSGDNLVTCNEGGTAVAGMEKCSSGMCDAKGGDCNKCEPGTKKCEGNMVMTCDATGQTYEPMPCSGGGKCVGLGQCVECTANEDCSDLTAGCKVGACMRNACMAANAPSTTQCTASGNKPGKCSSGTCVCEPQCDGKQCGDNGCMGSCGSCSGGTKCSSSNQCVECTANADCKSSNPCEAGSCSGGSCSFTKLNSGSCNGSGTCRNGTCCIPSCTGKCGGEDNGCGTPCPDRCSGRKCTNGVCCQGSCTGKCGGEDNGCGVDCPNPCSSDQTCSKGQCSVCPKGQFGCGFSSPECWNCSRTIRQGEGQSAIAIFQCNSDGSNWTIVNYCGVSDCTSSVETATCFGSSGSCSWTGGTLPDGQCAP